ncbi:MAG: hypothetical protein NTV51_31475, partial [Verrucomicrobia bacterium]|nr:hypothetical protein [Verrucomicrobiota bacterium]
NVYVADLNNDVVWKITPAGIITAFAGAALQNGSVDGAGAAARFFHPKSLAIDAAGALYVVETYNATVRKITPGGVVTTLAGKALATGRTDGPAADARFGDLRAVAVSPTGDVYVIDGTSLRKIATNGTVSTVLPPSPADPAQRLSNPNGLAVDRAGNVYIADTGNYVVRRLTPAGVLSVVAGQIGASGTTDGAVATARLSGPRALAVDDAGNLFIGDGRVLRRLGTDGMVITLAGGSSGWANGTGTGARFSSIYAIAVDPAGRLYHMDGANDAVRVATPPTYALFLPTMITKQPATASPTAGGTASLSVTADGTGPFTYQWLRDGTVVPGATAATLTLASAQSGDSGTYTVVVTGAGGAVTSTAATLTIQTPIRITNLAIRAGAGSGDATLITGFVVAGGAKPILVRGVGPALTSYGVVGVLPNPRLGLYSGETLLAQNDNWSDDPDATTVAQTTSRLSFALAPNSLDAAMLKTLSDGAYTAQVGSADGRNGIALLEMYDTGSAGPNQGRLVNVSARTSVGTGENILIAGFTITGFPSSLRTTLLIRGVGPALRGYGVEGTLADPQIALFANSTLIQQNDDWGQNGSQITTTSAQVGAFPLPVGSKDAAMVVTLGPGSYTVQLSGVASTTGVGLIEIYEVR